MVSPLNPAAIKSAFVQNPIAEILMIAISAIRPTIWLTAARRSTARRVRVRWFIPRRAR
jgi:hypothetical protein